MQAGWCLICGAGKRRELACYGSDPVFARLANRLDATVRFVICDRCGHVYQDPMPDEEDLAQLETGLWRTRVRGGTARQAGRWQLAERLQEAVEAGTGSRTALAIGWEADGLLAFGEQGWDLLQVAPTALTWRRPGQRAGLSTLSSDRKFSVILLQRVVETLPDPVPILRAVRPYLEEGGILFVSSVNLLDPPPAERLRRELLIGSHVRLYSPGTLQTVLARSGFRTIQTQGYEGDMQQGILARPADWVGDHSLDDPEAILQMYRVLQWPGSTDVLGWNLAALAETQSWVLPGLCQAAERDGFVVRRSGRCLVGIEGRTASGERIEVVRWGEQDGDRSPSPGSAGSTSGFVQLGLGSGELATALAERLTDGQHLFVWEADPVLAKRTLEIVDLSPLWLSRQVSLLVGPKPDLPAALRQRLQAPTTLYVTRSARCWQPWVYREILGTLNLSGGAQAEAPVCTSSGRGAAKGHGG
ncbi:MAG: methyltransferase domain-containing protein [Nitrospirota bacterium]